MQHMGEEHEWYQVQQSSPTQILGILCIFSDAKKKHGVSYIATTMQGYVLPAIH